MGFMFEYWIAQILKTRLVKDVTVFEKTNCIPLRIPGGMEMLNESHQAYWETYQERRKLELECVNYLTRSPVNMIFVCSVINLVIAQWRYSTYCLFLEQNCVYVI